MRLFTSFFGFVLLILVLSFALSNKQDVVVGMWPLQDSFTAPLYAVGLGPLFAGLLLGGLWGWLSSFSSKIEVRRLNKKVGSLSEKIGDMEKSAVLEKIKTKTKTSFWSRE